MQQVGEQAAAERLEEHVLAPGACTRPASNGCGVAVRYARAMSSGSPVRPSVRAMLFEVPSGITPIVAFRPVRCSAAARNVPSPRR